MFHLQLGGLPFAVQVLPSYASVREKKAKRAEEAGNGRMTPLTSQFSLMEKLRPWSPAFSGPTS